MSMMRALMWQEWRSQRILVLIVTAISVLACMLVQRGELLSYDIRWAVSVVIPFLTVIFVGVAGTDMLVCTEKNGRAHLQMLLPIPPTRALASKISYLLLASLAFVAIMMMFNAWLLSGTEAVHNRSSIEVLASMVARASGHPMMLCVALFGGCVLFFSSLFQRRSMAIWCAGVLFAWLAYLWFAFDSSATSEVLSRTPVALAAGEWEMWAGDWMGKVLPLAAIAAALLAGSIAGYRPTLVLEGRGFRRVVFSITALFLPLLLGGVAIAYSVSEFVTLDPYSHEEARVSHMVLSADEESVAVFMLRGNAHHEGSRDRDGYVYQLALEDGELELVPCYGVSPQALYEQKCAEDGSLVVSGWSLASRERGLARLDLDTGELEPLQRDDGWAAMMLESNNPLIERRLIDRGNDDGRNRRYELSWEGGSTELEARRGVIIDWRRFIAYYQPPSGGLHGLDLREGRDRVLVPSGQVGQLNLHRWLLSGGGGYLALETYDCGTRLIRLADGADVTPFDGVDSVRWDRRSQSDRYVLLGHRTAGRTAGVQGKSLFDLSTGQLVDLGPGWFGSLTVTSRGQALLTDGVSIHLYEPGEAEPRVLYGPREQHRP